MMLQGARLEHMAAAYVLGSLGLPARRRFETLLQRDAAARRVCQQWEERLAGLAQDLPPVRPADDAWAAVQARIQQVSRPPVRSARQHWLWIAALLVAIAVMLLWARLPD